MVLDPIRNLLHSNYVVERRYRDEKTILDFDHLGVAFQLAESDRRLVWTESCQQDVDPSARRDPLGVDFQVVSLSLRRNCRSQLGKCRLDIVENTGCSQFVLK